MPDSTNFTPLERKLLTRIQGEFPLCAEPYAALAGEFGVSRGEICELLATLRRRGVVRRIGGSFVPHKLGYVSVLVAVRAAPVSLPAVAARAAAYPGVTHCYERESTYNLWFTLIAEDQERLEPILADIRGCAGVTELHALPALKTLKIRVQFDFDTPPDSAAAGPLRPAAAAPPEAVSTAAPLRLDATDRRLIPRCCGDIGAGERPFCELAAELHLTEAEVLRRLHGYREAGALRRFGAVLRHQAAGYTANAMSGWNVPEADVDRVGAILAASPQVSHCYVRPRLPDWPCNLYGMIHGAARDECLAVAARVARDTGIRDYQLLFSVREFKKTSMVYLES
jgi:DNA-binding Lrp family transcriptional regulator